MHYDPILCMNVPDKVTAKDELSLAQKKQVVTELKGYLKKSYNFSDESEYARAYEDLRHMFTTGSRKSISGLFKNTVKKTGAHDSASAIDNAIKIADGATGDKLYADVKAIYNLFSNILLTYSNEQSVQKLANEGTKKCLELAAKVKGVRDEAIKTADASTGHKVVVFVGNYLRSIGKNNSTGKYDKIVRGVRSLLSQSLLDDEGLKKAAEHEADRLLKKYNL